MLKQDAVQILKLDAASRAANSGKSADPILHLDSPHLKSCSNALGDFKNKKGLA
jgi:hypothetical protein